MRAWYISNCFSTARKISSHELLAESTFISTEFEVSASLIVDINSFLIKEAKWNIFRSPCGTLNGVKDIPELKGKLAYIKAGRDLRQAVSQDASGLAGRMMVECLKAIIQAEAFVLDARGYESTHDYENYCDKIHLNRCRYYSNLDRVSRKRFEQISIYYERESNFFSRITSCKVYRHEGGGWTATVSFSDSFHELNVNVINNDEGIVIDCTGNYLRAPDFICFECSDLLNKLKGINIAKLNNDDIRKMVGCSDGCNHLVDVVFELSKAIRNTLGLDKSFIPDYNPYLIY
jgi:hypothetical protein